jgi:hypothetical protein
MSKRYNIDESHNIIHSLNVLNYAHNIFTSEVHKTQNKYLKNHERIIYISAMLHDIADKKYINEKEGIDEINNFLIDKIEPNESDIIQQIISTMSYSTIKKNGMPDLGQYQLAFNIVREADLLTAYDFDRCMIYNLRKKNEDIIESFDNAKKLFQERVLKYIDDDLFVTNYSKNEADKLHLNALIRINSFNRIFFNECLNSEL